MNFFNILDNIQKFDGDAYERLEYTSRRYFMNRISTKVAAIAAPGILAASMNKAFAQSADAVNVLNFALTLEYLENDFYAAGNANANMFLKEYKRVFAQIGKHEQQHVTFLEITLGPKKIKKPDFNFTKGDNADIFSNLDKFVFLSHALEDTGVRAYKGQAGNLMKPEDKPYLEAALQIHSVEARHASIVRKILAKIRNKPEIKSWITNEEGSPEPVYKGMTSEKNTVHLGSIDATQLAGLKGLIPDGDIMKAVTEAFDEILTKEEVTAIATPFFA